MVKCMKQSIRFSVIAGIIATTVGGCSQNLTAFHEDQSIQGPKSLIERSSFQKIDLALLLAPKGNILLDGPTTEKIRQQYLQLAFNAFYGEATSQVLRRNRVQNRIIAASNQRCSEFKKFIKQFDSSSNLFLGGLTTLTAGLGAILTAASTVRALAGSAAIASGFRAEVNEAYFQQQTVQLLTNGFEATRKVTLESIRLKSPLTIDEYTVEQAIGEAVIYHDQCSLLAGLERVALDRKRADNPGLAQIGKVLDQLQSTRNKMNQLVGAPGSLNIAGIYSSETASVASSAATLPLVAFFKAENSKRALSATAEKIGKATWPNVTVNEPTALGVQPPADATNSLHIAYMKRLIRHEEYEDFLTEIDDAKDKLSDVDGKKKIAGEIEKLVDGFEAILIKENKAALTKLQNEIFQQVAEAQTRDAGSGRDEILGEINKMKAQAASKIKALPAAIDAFDKKHAEAGKLIKTIATIEKRVKKFNDAAAS